MENKINIEKAERIWKAEYELQRAIHDATKDGIVVEVKVDEFTSGTQAPRLLLKQVIRQQ